MSLPETTTAIISSKINKRLLMFIPVESTGVPITHQLSFWNMELSDLFGIHLLDFDIPCYQD